MAGSNAPMSGAVATQRYAQAEIGHSTSLGDILERVLDKGLVIAGDIQVNLLDIELLTIKLRLVIASLDTARDVGINWWENDPWLNAEAGRKAALSEGDGGEPEDGVQELKDELARLRSRVRELESGHEQ